MVDSTLVNDVTLDQEQELVEGGVDGTGWLVDGGDDGPASLGEEFEEVDDSECRF